MDRLAEAFAREGYHSRDIEFDIAIAKYLNSGGTIAGALARLNAAAARMPGVGQVNRAGDGLLTPAQPRQPVEDDGASQGMPLGHTAVAPSSSFDRGGEGPRPVAHERHCKNALPVREPSTAQRSSDAAVAKMLSISVMDTLKIDGLAIGKWSVARARVEGKRKTREGYILRAAAGMVANAAGRELLSQVVKVSEMQLILQKAAEVADAAI